MNVNFENIVIKPILKSPMIQSKDSVMSTFQSRRNLNTQTAASRFRLQFKYDINDYLPSDAALKNNYHLYSFAKNEEQMISHIRARTKTVGNSDDHQNSFDIFPNDKIQKLTTQIEKITVESAKKEKNYEQKIKSLQSSLQITSNNEKKLEIQNKVLTQKLKEMSDFMNKIAIEKTELLSEIQISNKKYENRRKNIRIFSQKYEVNLQPKTKHSYSIEVQTQKMETKEKQSMQMQQIPKLVLPNLSNELRSHRKTSCLGKPQFYQLYQQQNNDQQFQYNNQLTSRSQVVLSGLKPKKPVFMDNVSQFYEKQNDRKRANQKLEDRISGNISQISKNKMKVKNEEVEIYPIEESQIQDIANAILSQ